VERLIAWPLLVLVGGALLQGIAGRWLAARARGTVAFLCGLAALGGVLGLLPALARGQTVTVAWRLWESALPLAYHVDGLSLVFALLATGIGSAILLYCIRYMEHETGTARFYALMLIFIAGMYNLVCAANLLLVYFSWEVIGLCSYFLVGFWYQEPAAANGARKVLVMTHLAGYGLLAAILLLYVKSGSFLWTDPAVGAALTTGLFLLLLVAAMTKSVLFPLHTWIPEAMNAPTPVSALLHSACYVKAGVYLIARLYALTPWQPGWNTLVTALGCVTLCVGALCALAQTDLKRLLAYSTISQLGYIITGLGLGTPLGVAAGLFYCLSHGLFKGTLFLCAGAVQHATGTRDLRRLGGLAARMPVTARIWLIAAAAIVGVPLTNGFVAKWLLYAAALEAHALVVVLVAWVVSTFTAFYILKATVSVFYGDWPVGLDPQQVHEAAPTMRVGMGTLAALCLLFGLAPQLLLQGVVAPAVHALGFPWEVLLSWSGVQTVAAGAPVTVGAALVIGALLVGAALYGATRPARAGGVPLFTGGDPLPAGDRVGAVDFSELAASAFAPLYRVTDPDPLYLILWHALQTFAAGLARLLSALEAHPLPAMGLIAVVAVAVIWWV